MNTVNDLIEALQALVNDHPAAGNLPLRIAYQPHYPLHVALERVRVDVQRGADNRPDAPVLHLVAGSCPYGENPYASRDLWSGGDDLSADYTEALAEVTEYGEDDDDLPADDDEFPNDEEE